jgi:hypothetical protein
MFRRSSLFAVLALATLSVPPSARAQSHQMPPGMTHDEHLKQLEKEAELKRRGAAAMGFDQTLTSHHFLLSRDGGSVEVTANEAADTTSLEPGRPRGGSSLPALSDPRARDGRSNGCFQVSYHEGLWPPSASTTAKVEAIVLALPGRPRSSSRRQDSTSTSLQANAVSTRSG